MSTFSVELGLINEVFEDAGAASISFRNPRVNLFLLEELSSLLKKMSSRLLYIL